MPFFDVFRMNGKIHQIFRGKVLTYSAACW